MTVVRAKPTSAGRRFRSFQVDQNIHKGKPHAPLLATKSKNGGRNNSCLLYTSPSPRD